MLIIRRINYINTTSVIYQRLYWYNWFSWWWARGCSKHVENLNKYMEKNCASSWPFTMTHIIRKFEYVFRWTSHAATDRRTDTSQEVSCRTVEEIWGREMTALHCRCSRGCVWPVGIYRVFWKVAVGSDVFLARQLLLLPEVARVLTLTAALPTGFVPQWAGTHQPAVWLFVSPQYRPAYVGETDSEFLFRSKHANEMTLRP